MLAIEQLHYKNLNHITLLRRLERKIDRHIERIVWLRELSIYVRVYDNQCNGGFFLSLSLTLSLSPSLSLSLFVYRCFSFLTHLLPLLLPLCCLLFPFFLSISQSIYFSLSLLSLSLALPFTPCLYLLFALFQ